MKLDINIERFNVSPVSVTNPARGFLIDFLPLVTPLQKRTITDRQELHSIQRWKQSAKYSYVNPGNVEPYILAFDNFFYKH